MLHHLAFVSAVATFAAVLALGSATDRPSDAPRPAASRTNAAAGDSKNAGDARRRSVSVQHIITPWGARYEALKERQFAALDASTVAPCRPLLSARERYLAFKLRQGDGATARTPTRGCL